MQGDRQFAGLTVPRRRPGPRSRRLEELSFEPNARKAGLTVFLTVLTLLISAPIATPAPSTPDAIGLFRSACLTGEVKLDRALVTPRKFTDLPNVARAVIGRAIYRGPGAQPYPEMPLHRDFPNPIYRVGAKDLFLIATSAEPIPAARFADSCMVVWKGDDFERAHQAILPNAPAVGERTHKAGIGYVSANDGQQVLTAALWANWTILKASPASTEPSPPVPFPGAEKH